MRGSATITNVDCCFPELEVTRQDKKEEDNLDASNADEVSEIKVSDANGLAVIQQER